MAVSLQQTINYDDADNFTFDTAKVQIAASKASLKLTPNTGQAFSQAFASDSGFTYDAAKAEFTGGVLRTKAQRPANATFGARFSDVIAGNFGDGDLTATETGAPIIFENKLQLTGGGRYVSFDAAGNVAPLGMVGTVRFRFTTNYNGSPSANQIFLTIGSGSENKIQLFHHANGAFFVLFNDSTGANQISSSVSPFVAVAGTEVELEMSWDLSAGTPLVRFFGEGYLVVEIPAPFTRDDTNVDVIQIGDNDSDFSIRDLVFFNTVQHTANYTAHEYTLPAGDFVESVATLPVFTYSGPGALQAFTAWSATVAGSPRFILNGRYWNGSAWAVSNNTYAQANPSATVATNIAALAAGATLTVKVAFTDGNTLASVDVLTATYTGQIYPTDDPAIEPATTIGLDGLDGFSAVSGGTGGVRYQLRLNSTLYYWTGATWSASDGSYAQANTAADVHANRAHASLVALVSAGVSMRLRALLHSDTGAASPDLTSATILYNFFAETPTPPAECLVYAHVRDILGDAPATRPLLIASIATAYAHGSFLIAPSRKVATADDEGRFEISLVETATPAKKYRFQLQYLDEQGNDRIVLLGQATVPNQSDVNLATLTFT